MTKLSWLGLLIAAFIIRADEPEPYTLSARSEIISERGLVTRYAWRTEQAVLSFIPPQDWDVSVRLSEKKLLLHSVALRSGLTLCIATNAQTKIPDGATPRSLRNHVLRQMPEARIREEFQGHTGAGSGPIIDLEIDNGETRTFHRLAWIPFSAGVVELELIAPQKSLPYCHGAWTMILNSLRIDSLIGKR